MSPERWQQIAEPCDSALSLEPDRRAAFLEQACAGDAVLRQELEALLACDELSPRFLETPALEAAVAALTDQATEAEELLPAGSQIGPYRIVALLGAGGMGQVYQARDTRLERDVALKFLPAASAHEPEALIRFQREARAASALNHPNICTLHDIGEHEGRPVLVMELLEGQSLKDRLQAGPLPVGQVLELAVQISDALQAAHLKGIVHRDIKPGNLFLTSRGEAKILDFGLSKLLSESQPPPEAGLAPAGQTLPAEDTISRAGAVMGTVAYMSPDQAEGRPVDASSDVFSLGAVLYEMLAGCRPFQGESSLATLSAILRDRPVPLRQLRADVPWALERIVNRCLEKNREARYASAAELWKDLAGLRSRLARRAGLRAILRRPRFAVPAVLVLVAVAVGIGWISVQNARLRWVHRVALPEIARLTNEERYCAALRLIQRARRYSPGDPDVQRFWQISASRLSFRTHPPGADVYMRDYLDVAEEAEWLYLGRTPIESAVVPAGDMPYRITKAGFEMVEGTSGTRTGATATTLIEVTLRREGTGPPGMIRVPAQQANLVSLVLALPDRDLSLEEFWLARYEVTNRQFKEFVDRGGYENRNYWKHPFVKEGRVIPWEEALAAFRDATGRPGPATWESGTYPAGQADYPVSGVSWYEAAAHAEFAGKSLPTVHHWRSAAGISGLMANILKVSNFSGKGPAPVGSHRGLSPYGNYDMAGNVREWCWTPAGAQRYILGGAWNDPSYAFYHPEARAPMDRSPGNGFRCARYAGLLPEELAGEVPPSFATGGGTTRSGTLSFRCIGLSTSMIAVTSNRRSKGSMRATPTGVWRKSVFGPLTGTSVSAGTFTCRRTHPRRTRPWYIFRALTAWTSERARRRKREDSIS
jgi:hypothetical protein